MRERDLACASPTTVGISTLLAFDIATARHMTRADRCHRATHHDDWGEEVSNCTLGACRSEDRDSQTANAAIFSKNAVHQGNLAQPQSVHCKEKVGCHIQCSAAMTGSSFASNPHIQMFVNTGLRCSAANPHLQMRVGARSSRRSATAFKPEGVVHRRVVVLGLQSKKEHNGSIGTVTAYSEVKQRFAVLTDAGGQPLFVKASNLDVLPYCETLQNTPPFEAALRLGKPNAKADAIRAALDAGHMLNTRPAPLVAVIDAAVRTFQAWGDAGSGLGVPNPMFVRVAMEAGLKTEGALQQLFTPDNVHGFDDAATFRAALERQLGLEASGGMSMLPIFMQVASEPSAVALLAAHREGVGALAELYKKNGGELGKPHISNPKNRLY